MTLKGLSLLLLFSGIWLHFNQPKAEFNEVSLDWKFDIEEAKKEAKNKQVPILISFAGSDWCKPCIKLTREIFTTQEFAKYADDNLVLVLADFPRYKKNRLPKPQMEHNESLARQYNPQGEFPLVVIIDQDGTVLARAGYMAGGPDAFIQQLESSLP